MPKKMLAVACACLAATPAYADWQYTKWGWSPAEVIAASNGSLRPGDGAKSAQGPEAKDVVGSYVAGDLTFKASLWFAGGNLATVSLTLSDDAQCRTVARDLLAKYGEPVERTGSSVQRSMWSDKPNGNRVTFIDTFQGYCELQYAPLNTAAASGL